MHMGWVMKLWGSYDLAITQNTNCGLGSVITGWVTMTQNPIATTAATCLTNALWIFNTYNAGSSSQTKSRILLDCTEDY